MSDDIRVILTEEYPYMHRYFLYDTGQGKTKCGIQFRYGNNEPSELVLPEHWIKDGYDYCPECSSKFKDGWHTCTDCGCKWYGDGEGQHTIRCTQKTATFAITDKQIERIIDLLGKISALEDTKEIHNILNELILIK